MIIKSLSRKKPSFIQLYDYMMKWAEKEAFSISKNLYNTDRRRDVIAQFVANSKYLPKRKNWVFLYHEIISLPEQKGLPIAKQKEILTHLANRYLEQRTGLNLAFGVIHEEKAHLHCHLMISSNEVGSSQRQRLSKAEFSKIQKELESYKLEKFPELADKILYNKELTKNKAVKSKSKDRENQLKHRTGQESRAETVQKQVERTIKSAYSIKEFTANLQKQGFEFYVRGSTAGIIDKSDGTKYRLKRLDLETQYQNLLEFERAREKEIGKIRGMQERDVEDGKER